MLIVITASIAIAQSARTTRSAPRDSDDIVPTSRQQPVTWHYTFERPADSWRTPNFDDSSWQSGPDGFGTRGTPGISPNTIWSTADIWMRCEFALPSTGFDPAAIQLLVFHDEDVEVYFDGLLAARAGG